MKLDLLAALNGERTARRACVLITDIAGGQQRLVLEADLERLGSVGDPLAAPVAEALRTGRSGAVEIAGSSTFLNVQLPPIKLVVTGAVHISQALQPMARALSLDLIVIDRAGPLPRQSAFRMSVCLPSGLRTLCASFRWIATPLLWR